MNATTIKFLVMLAFIAADIITGYAKGICTNKRDSKTMKQGLWNKAGEILVVSFLLLVDFMLPLIDVHLGFMTFSGGVIYIVLMEVTSICENLIIISPALEPVLGKLVASAKIENDKNKTEDENRKE